MRKAELKVGVMYAVASSQPTSGTMPSGCYPLIVRDTSQAGQTVIGERPEMARPATVSSSYIVGAWDDYRARWSGHACLCPASSDEIAEMRDRAAAWRAAVETLDGDVLSITVDWMCRPPQASVRLNDAAMDAIAAQVLEAAEGAGPCSALGELAC